MNSRERIKLILNFQIPDRIGIADAPWPETLHRWSKETGKKIWFKDFLEYFDMDFKEVIKLDTSFQFKYELLEETDEFRLISDSEGRNIKYWKNQTGVPQPLDYKIKEKKDWLLYKERLNPNLNRITLSIYGEYEPGGEREIKKSSFNDVLKKYSSISKDKFILLMMSDPYEGIMSKIGDERLLIKLVDEPELIKDMFDTYTNLVINTCKLMFSKNIFPDGIFLGGDIAYKNGLLFSPEIYKELLYPFHKKICYFFKENNIPVIYHSDGNVLEALPYLISAGITAIQPLEAKAGMDVRKLKNEYGNKLVFMGNIDVTKMSNKKDIEEEVKSKVLIAKEGGGYIYHSDHTVPPHVSFENYKYVIELVRKYGIY